MDSPRGRIVLMRVGHEEGETISPEMVTHFDRCLGCMACVTACPSGVQYDKLIERVRPQIERSEARSWQERAYRKAIFAVFTHPGAAAGAGAGRQARAEARAAGAGRAAEVAARAGAGARRRYRPLPKVEDHQGAGQARHRRVHAGLHPARVLRRRQRRDAAGAVAPRAGRSTPRAPRAAAARCRCTRASRRRRSPLAEATIAAYEGYDRIVTNVAGCGSVMKDYGHLLDTDRAREFSAKVVDVHELLASRGAAGRAQADRAARRLPRRLPPRARPGRAPAAARAAARHPRARAARARRVGAVLRLGRASTTCSSPRPPASSARARPRTCARPAPTRSPPPTRAARCRSRATSTSRSITR